MRRGEAQAKFKREKLLLFNSITIKNAKKRERKNLLNCFDEDSARVSFFFVSMETTTDPRVSFITLLEIKRKATMREAKSY